MTGMENPEISMWYERRRRRILATILTKRSQQPALYLPEKRICICHILSMKTKNKVTWPSVLSCQHHLCCVKSTTQIRYIVICKAGGYDKWLFIMGSDTGTPNFDTLTPNF